jgi:hypothetical protein
VRLPAAGLANHLRPKTRLFTESRFLFSATPSSRSVSEHAGNSHITSDESHRNNPNFDASSPFIEHQENRRLMTAFWQHLFSIMSAIPVDPA